ncbi:MAG: CoA transferase [Deltaproteobacteria bacterium]|nr:CoA transferase [Deltaproteobacteria bacterium]
MKRALDGIRVLDMGSYIAAPYCAMCLADHGAEVVRVEPPGGKIDRELGPFAPDGQSMMYGLSYQRNKKNITLNLRSETGKRLLDELVKKFDILVHNYPKGTEEADTLDYDRLSGINPALIVVAVSGFGQNGPYAERPCFDAIAQAMSGTMSYTGYPGGEPLRAGPSYIDFNTGARAALGAVMACYERTKSGLGQLVDVALFDVAFGIATASGCAAEYQVWGEVRKAVGNGGFYAYCCSAPAQDGFLMINIVGNNLWRRMCRVLDREDMITDDRFKDNLARYRNYPAIDEVVYAWIEDKTVAEAMAILDKAGIPCGRVNDVPASLKIPQVAAREMLVEIDYPGTGTVPVLGVEIKLSRTPGKVARRASFLGEDNEAVYSGLLGYDPGDLKRFREENTI